MAIKDNKDAPVQTVGADNKFGIPRFLWVLIGTVLSVALYAWVLRKFDFDKFLSLLGSADYRLVILLPFAIVAEQLLRGVKWRQLLSPLGAIGVWRLFGAVMAGYFSNHVAPVRISPLMRAWLVARRGGLSVSAVLASVTIERLIDGVVFLFFVVAAVSLVTYPGDAKTVESRLWIGVVSSIALFTGLGLALIGWRWLVRQRPQALDPIYRRLPRRIADPIREFGALFADGIVLPREIWRLVIIVVCAILMKFMAATHLAIAGAAFGIYLEPMQYLFIMVCLGFLIILASTLKIVGGFIAGSVFLLQGFGIAAEPALAIALVVRGCSFLTVVTTGAAALWIEGVSLADLKTRADLHR